MNRLFLVASWLAGAVMTLIVQTPLYAQSASEAISVGIRFLKRSPFEVAPGPVQVLIGPQAGLELEWGIANGTTQSVELPPEADILNLRVSRNDVEIPVSTSLKSIATIRRRDAPGSVDSTVASITLEPGASVSVRGSTRRADGADFSPGTYRVEIVSGPFQSASLDTGSVITLRIEPVGSMERRRQYHMIEAAFHTHKDDEVALQHYLELTRLPGASWTAWLAVAECYGSLGRHREATEVFRRIMPDLLASAKGPAGTIVREAGHLRMAAKSFAVENDTVTARELLLVEGRTPDAEIAATIQRLRQTARVRQ